MALQILRAAEQRASTLKRLRVEQFEARNFLVETIREVSLREENPESLDIALREGHAQRPPDIAL